MSGAHLRTHWGPDPGHGGLTLHQGSRTDCSGPDCVDDEVKRPCPLCKQGFDGHWADMDGHKATIPVSWWTDEMGIVELKLSEDICPNCAANGKGCKRYVEVGFAVHEDCEYMQEYLRSVPWGRSRSERSDPEGEQ